VGAVFGITGSFATVANTANQVVFGIVSGGANTDGVITWLDVTFDAAASAAGIKVQLARNATNIPTLTSYTPNKLSAASQGTASAFSAFIPPITQSGGTFVPVKTWYFNPAAGVLIQYPLSREDYLLPGSTVWTALLVSTPAGVSPNCAFNCSWVELGDVMAALAGNQVVLAWQDGDADKAAVFAIKKMTAGDTVDLSAWFLAVKTATLIGTTVVGTVVLSPSGTVVTIPAGVSNDAGWLTAWGVAA
jgi:hypothetical protein